MGSWQLVVRLAVVQGEHGRVGEEAGPPLDLLDSDMDLMFAGRKGSDILGGKREHRGGENVVVSILYGVYEDDGMVE